LRVALPALLLVTDERGAFGGRGLGVALRDGAAKRMKAAQSDADRLLRRSAVAATGHKRPTAAVGFQVG